jgi:hypothetical protein
VTLPRLVKLGGTLVLLPIGTSRSQISIGRRGTIGKQGYGTVNTTGRTTQWPFRVGGVTSASGLRVIYGNGGRGFSDTPPTGSLIVSSTLLTPVSGAVASYPIGDGAASSIVPVRVTFSGLEDQTIAPNEWFASDVIPGVTVEEGDEVMFRTYVRSTSGSAEHLTDWATYHEGEANSPDFLGDATENMTATKIAEAQHFIYTPMALVATEWTA